MVTRIAFWSGPRNASTVLMRAWENRPDTTVVDEPFYAYYLKVTGIDHPGREEILARHPSDPEEIVRMLLAPQECPIFYQKQLAHHLRPEVPRAWLDEMRHAFLIRDPADMLAHWIQSREVPTPEDLGLPQMKEIYDRCAYMEPPVVDSCDLLDDPRGILTHVCVELGVPFDEHMLSWPAGPRESDGAWAPYWYGSVEASTGFRPCKRREIRLPERLKAVHAECMEYHRFFHERRLTVGP